MAVGADFQAGITFVVADFKTTNQQLGSLSASVISLQIQVNNTAKNTSGAFNNQITPAVIAANQTLTKMGATVVAAGSLVTAELFAMAQEASKFDQQLRLVGKISGATAEELTLLKNAAVQAGLATKFSPQEAVEGLRTLAQQGLNAKDSAMALVPVLKLAAVSLGELGVGDAAFLASQAVKGFGASVDDIPSKLDMLAKATNTFAINMSELPLGMGIVARGAQAMNQTMEESVIAFGLVKNVIPTVSRAASSAASAMERLTDSKRQDLLMSKFQVKAVDEATGKFRPFLDVINDISKASQKMTDAEKSNALIKIFGSQAAGGLNAILSQLEGGIKGTTGEVLKGADAIAFLREEMKNAEGTTASMADALGDTLTGQLTLFEGVRQTMRTVFGDALAASFKPVFKVIVTGLSFLTKHFEALPQSVKTIIGQAVLLGAVVTTLIGTFFTAGAAIAGLVALGPAMAVGFKIAALAVVGMIQVLGPFIALGALAFVAYKTNFLGIATLLTKVKVGFGALIEIVGNYKDGVTTMSEETSSSLQALGIFDFVVGLGGAMGSLKQAAIDVFDFLILKGPEIKGALLPAFEGLETIFMAVFGVGKTIFNALFGQVIPDSFDGTVMSIDGFKSTFNTILPIIQGVAEDAKTFANDFKAGLENAKPTILFVASIIKFMALNTWDLAVALGGALAAVGMETWTSLDSVFSELWNTGLILWGTVKQLGGAFNEIFNALAGLFPSLRNSGKEMSGMEMAAKILIIPIKILAVALSAIAFVITLNLKILGIFIGAFRLGFEGASRVAVASMNLVGGSISFVIDRTKALALALSGDLVGATALVESSTMKMEDSLRRAKEEFTRPLPDDLFGPPGGIGGPGGGGGLAISSGPGAGGGGPIQPAIPNVNVSMPGFEQVATGQSTQIDQLREINLGIQELASRPAMSISDSEAGYSQLRSSG